MTRDPSREAEHFEARKAAYAFGFATVAVLALVALALVALLWSNTDNAAKIVTPLGAVVGTVAGAYLGHHAGSEGRTREAAARERLEQALLARNEPSTPPGPPKS